MLKDRREAAQLLATRMRHLRGRRPLVLAIPRGAVPMGEILAEALDGDLDVVLVHKLGAPSNPEYAIGSVTEEGEVELREEALALRLPPGFVDEEASRQLDTLRRRRELYTPAHSGADPRERSVIVVDDGVATGATLEAALRMVRRRQPRELVAAMAVAPPWVLRRLVPLADEVICLEQPVDLPAVGASFRSFDQVSDEEVVAILQRNKATLRSLRRAPRPKRARC